MEKITIDGWSFDQIMHPGEVAAAYGVSSTTIQRWADSGRLVTTKTDGGHRRFSREQVQADLRERARIALAALAAALDAEVAE